MLSTQRDCKFQRLNKLSVGWGAGGRRCRPLVTARMEQARTAIRSPASRGFATRYGAIRGDMLKLRTTHVMNTECGISRVCASCLVNRLSHLGAIHQLQSPNLIATSHKLQSKLNKIFYNEYIRTFTSL
jgi:hypothetical protein